LLEYLVIVVFEVLPLGVTLGIRREPDVTILELIVYFSIVELLFQPLTDAKGVVRGHRHIPSVE